MHSHSHDHGHGPVSNTGKLALTILLNAVITIAEYIGGVLSGSLALISDAGHNLSDVLSLILGYTGEKISEKAPGKRYTFGLKRFEVLIALINALTLIFIGGFILFESIERYQNPVPINIKIMLPIAVVGLIGNVLSILILSNSRDSTLNMKAAFLHLLYDAVSSAGVIAAGIIIYFTEYLWLDLLISIIIVLMILWSTKDILVESMRIFLQGAPGHIDTDTVYEEIKKINGVKDVHNLHVWSINSTETFLSCHIELNDDIQDTDTIIQAINSLLSSEFSIEHTSIQMETANICGGDNRHCQ